MTMTGMCFMFWLIGLFFKFQLRGGGIEEPIDAEIHSRFQLLCSRLKLSGLKLIVGNKAKVSGGLLKNEVFISSGALKGLGASGVDFIMGHELAHKRFFDSKAETAPKWMIILGLCCLIITLISLRLKVEWTFYFFFVLPTVAFMFYMSWRYPNAMTSMGPEMELACDYVAMFACGGSTGAIEALEMISHGSKIDQKAFGYPSKDARIEQARRFDAGEKRTPYKNKFVEERVQEIIESMEPIGSEWMLAGTE